MITRRTALLGCLTAGAALHVARSHAALAEPTLRTMMIGSASGSALDRSGRSAGACLQGHLTPQIEIAIRNVPGEAGLTMLSALAAAPPDGMLFGWVSTPNILARMIDRGDAGLLGRIRLVGLIEREPIAFISRASDPVDSVPDIIRRAGDDADAVPLATPPAGSPPHLTALRLQALSQTRLNIVTFPSAAAAAQAVLAGNVSAAALGLSDAIDGLHDGTLSAIGIAAHRRFGLLPDTPVLTEAGIPLSAFIGRGIAVPAATPDEQVERLAAALQAVVADDSFVAEVQANGIHPVWKDGDTWHAEALVEQEILAKLWRTDPWLSSSGGAG